MDWNSSVLACGCLYTLILFDNSHTITCPWFVSQSQITITNIVGAFVAEVMTRGGVTDRLSVDLAGAGFEAAILIGGIILGSYVDRTKEYKKVTMACLLTTAFMCIVSNLQKGLRPMRRL